MKKNRKKLIILLSLLIFLSLFTLTILDYYNYSDIIKDDILNITKLASTNIYSEIQIELIKPIFVSLTMANDKFLTEWILEQKEQDKKIIQQYLLKIKDKYNYDSTFFVSNVTDNYYHHNNILKKVSKADPHDVWYYNLLDNGDAYALDVDTDQAANGDLTFFVNCLVHDDDKNILGITGVGVKMQRIRKILQEYNEKLNVQVCLISPDGTVQIHADENIIEKQNIFDNAIIAELEDEIIAEKSKLMVFDLGDKYDSNYFISYYIEELDWYLIVQKDTLILKDALKKQVVREMIIFAIAFLFVTFMILSIVKRYQRKNVKLATTDILTDLKNRAAFDDYLNETISTIKKTDKAITLVIIDVDDFKKINDTYGHISGDTVLKAVAKFLESLIRNDDMLARWGGDEFAVILNCDLKASKKILQRIKDSEKQNEILEKYNICFSIGMSEFKNGDTAESLLIRADKALYKAKANGKNQICDI